MTLVGADGNDLPEVMSNGVTSYDYVAINGRVFTDYQREAFDLNFGVGLAQALASPTLSQGVMEQRLMQSFQGDPGYVGVDSIEVQLTDGRIYTIDLELEAK